MNIFYQGTLDDCPKCKTGKLDRIPRKISHKLIAIFISNQYKIKAYKCDNCQKVIGFKTIKNDKTDK